MTENFLENEFDQAMMEIYVRAKSETGYNASIFLKMLYRNRGLETASRLIHSPKESSGYTKLWQMGRLDLTVEALIVKEPKWHELFTNDEIAICSRRLMKYNYVMIN